MEDHIVFHRDSAVLDLLDQRKLPASEERFLCRTTADVITALQVMVVRGAPAIGVSAAFGCAIALRESVGPDWREKLRKHLADLRAARPTAVNLAWAVDHMTALWERNAALGPEDLMKLFISEAETMRRADIASCMAIGRFGLPCVHDNDVILTHCNAGALATAGYGTALGVVRTAFENRKNIRVIADETRPFLQGARLTAWELQRDGIPVTVACDNACASLMSRGFVSLCVVGADPGRRHSGPPLRHPLLRGCPSFHHRPLHARRKAHPHRGAPRLRGHHHRLHSRHPRRRARLQFRL